MFKLFGFSKNKNCIFVWMEGVDRMLSFSVIILLKRLVPFFFSPEKRLVSLTRCLTGSSDIFFSLRNLRCCTHVGEHTSMGPT